MFAKLITRVATKRTVNKISGLKYCSESEAAISGNKVSGEVPVITGERSVNKITLIGRVGRDPEVRGSEERPVTSFSLATSVTLRNSDGGYRQITDWHRISIFRTNLQQWSANAVKRGDRVYVTGAVRYGKYVNRDTNQLTPSCTIIADDLVVLAKKFKEEFETNEDYDTDQVDQPGSI